MNNPGYADIDAEVIIVGAGLSGIGAAIHLKRAAPNRSIIILEARSSTGGTWDLFRYPGVRSDSDMHTLGYNFKPWPLRHSIAEGAEIKDYIDQAALEFGVAGLVRLEHRVIRANWDRQNRIWNLDVITGEQEKITLRSRFVYVCSGYYDYDNPYVPEIAGMADFEGTLIHPQRWPKDFDYSGKRVVIVGSGATAVTLVPAMTHDAQHVTMLQRSPGYVISRPRVDRVGNFIRAVLPRKAGYRAMRWKHRLEQRWLFRMARRRPEYTKRRLLAAVARAIGDTSYVKKHFTPKYNPWDERLCLVPDNDLFDAIKTGKASVETDHIERLEADGIRLKSGRLLRADVIVLATGLTMRFAGGLPIEINGEAISIPERTTYRSCMLDGVPNLIFAFGYTNSSFTLRTDLVADFVCRMISHMEQSGFVTVTPIAPKLMSRRPWFDEFQPGYIKRALDNLPLQGDHPLWQNSQDYEADKRLFELVPPTDASLVYEK